MCPILYAIYIIYYILRITSSTPHTIHYTPHWRRLLIERYILYIIYYIEHLIRYILYAIYYILHPIYYVLYFYTKCTMCRAPHVLSHILCAIYYTLHTIYCTLILCAAHYILYIIGYTSYTMRHTLLMAIYITRRARNIYYYASTPYKIFISRLLLMLHIRWPYYRLYTFCAHILHVYVMWAQTCTCNI